MKLLEFKQWLTGFLAGVNAPLTQEQIGLIEAKLSQVEGPVDPTIKSMWTSTSTQESLGTANNTKHLLHD